MFGVLIAQHGNQCALITGSYSPCRMEIAGAPADEAKCLLVQIAATSGILAEDYNSEGSGADRAERWVTAGIRGRVLEMRDEGKGPGQ
jgi:hypothetical protein